MVLAIDTMRDCAISVFLGDRERIIAQKEYTGDYKVGERMVEAVSAAMHSKSAEEIEAIGVTISGSSFTSVRIGIAVANALGFAWGVHVIGIGSEVKGRMAQEFVLYVYAHMQKAKKGRYAFPVYEKEPNITI